jgi:hypothetical protein
MSQGCSGIDITPLVLSDTFNTWFERTNEMIESLNDITILGLEPFAETPSSFRGLKINPGIGNSCFKTIQLMDGPFIGFTSGDGNTGVYGEGTEENPYKLTLRIGGGESAFGGFDSPDTITGDDMVPVSDTSQNGLFRLAPVATFITRIVGGNKISAQFANGVYTISWVDLNFIPSFSIQGTNNNTALHIGIGKFKNNAPIQFNIGVSSSSGVGVNTSTITFTQTMGQNNTISPLTISGTGSVTSPATIIPDNLDSFGYSSDKSRNIRFEASITSNDVSFTEIPFEPENIKPTVNINFGWRFIFVTSPDPNLNSNTITLPPNPPTTVHLDVRSRSTNQNNLSVQRPSGASLYYMYFVYSDAGNNNVSDYSWSPTIYNNAIELGSPELNAWINRGITSFNPNSSSYGGESLRVLRFRNSITDDNFSFAIGGNSTSVPPTT